jgi:general secretion pathway protein C
MTYKILETGLKASILIITAFIAADMVNVLTKGALLTLPSFTAPQKIKKKEAVLPSSFTETSGDVSLSAPEGLPALKLVGTVIGAHPYAVIFDPASNKQDIYRGKDDIGNGWIIHIIDKNKIVLRKGTTEEVLEVKFIEGGEAVPSLKPASAKTGLRLDPRDVEGALSDMNTVMTQARVVPNLVEGKTRGYRIFNVLPGSIYTKLGIQNNDIVERVNGVEINSPDALYQLFQQIKSERKIALDFNRGGRRESVAIEIR